MTTDGHPKPRAVYVIIMVSDTGRIVVSADVTDKESLIEILDATKSLVQQGKRSNKDE